MELVEDLGLVTSTSFQPLDVLIKPLPVTKSPLPQYILDIAKRQNKEKEHKWTEEEQKQKDKEQNRKEGEQRHKEEERAEIEAARKEYLKIVLSRMKLMRKVGRPVTLMHCKNLDARELLNRKSSCEEINWGNGPVDKEILLEKEKALWNAAVEYRKVQNMDSEYDLIPSNMTLFPIMSKKCMWYHCNLVGCKRETPLKVVQQYFFLEINRTRGKTDTVTACIALDDDIDNTCNACPSHSGILHPCKGGFTCGSKEGPSKEDLGATPARTLDRDAVSPGIPAPLRTLGNETLGPITSSLSALVGGGTSRPSPPAAAAIGTPPKSKSLTAMPNGRPGLITKRHLEIALALALAGGGTSSYASSEDNPKCK